MLNEISRAGTVERLAVPVYETVSTARCVKGRQSWHRKKRGRSVRWRPRVT